MPARRAVAVVALLLAATAGWAESVHREVLPSGLVVIVQEFHATPAVEVRVSVRAGPLSEGPLLGSGASVLLQRLLVSSGSAAQGADEVKRAIARLGNEFHATTTVASTSYCLSTVSDKTGNALALLASMLSNYQYSQLDLQREREAVLAMPAPTPEVLAELLLNSLLYRQHPARLPVTGAPRMMDQLTVDLMRRYQAARYTAANTVVTVVGNVNINDVRKWADQAFAHYSVGGYQPATPFIEPTQYAPRYASGQLELPEQRVVLAWRSEAMEHPAQPALSVLAELLGAPGHGLLDRAFAARSLPRPVTVTNRAPIDQAGCIAFAFACAPLQRADCEQTLRACLDTLVKDGPSVDALASAKAALRRRLSERATSAAAIAEDLASWELAAGDPGFGRRHREAIEAITADDVVRVARRYIVTDMDAHACTVVLRPGAESLASGSGGTVPPPTGTLAPEIVDLGRGARLIVRQDQELPLVHLRLGIGGGAGIEEPAVAGIGAVLAELATRGADGRTRTQIDELCQRAGYDLTADCGPHALGLALTCLPEELDRGLQLLLDLATRPSLPAEELAQVKANTEQRREATEAAWDERLLAAVRGALLGEHYGARSPQGSRDAVAGLDRATILAHWKRLAVAPNLVIAVYGRFDRTALRATIDRLLASHALRDGPRPAPLVAVGTASASPMSVGFRPAELAAVALAWPAPPLAERGRDEAAMAVLSGLLAGVRSPGGRVNRALAVLPGSPTMAAVTEHYRQRGLYALYGRLPEADVDAAVQGVREQVGGLIAQLQLPPEDPKALGEAELATAKTMCLTERALAQERLPLVVAEHVETLLLGGDLAFSVALPARIAAVNIADLRRVAAAWLTQEPAVVVHRPRLDEPTGARVAPSDPDGPVIDAGALPRTGP